jgi:hypothetical protein
MKTGNLLIFLIITFLSINISAKEQSYRIELLIFSQEMPNSEVFDQIESKIIWPKRLADLSKYPEVSSNNKALLSSYRKLAGSGGQYQPLFYEAWIQKVKSNKFSKPMQITNDESTIDGYFQMQRGHYVHMNVDIEFSPENYEEETIIYRLNEKRRFKLNETHYLDHPKFGILARISPIK